MLNYFLSAEKVFGDTAAGLSGLTPEISQHQWARVKNCIETPVVRSISHVVVSTIGRQHQVRFSIPEWSMALGCFGISVIGAYRITIFSMWRVTEPL